MPMTVVVTRDVAQRFRGFLASCMLEIAPGVYTQPNMTAAVRQRILAVLREWFTEVGGGSIVITWKDRTAPAGQSVEVLGLPPKTLYDADGVILAHSTRDTTEDEDPENPDHPADNGT